MSIILKGIGDVYPDFTVLNVRTKKEMYWEHMGMMDDSNYREKAIRKIESYERNGYYPGESLILTFETEVSPMNSKIVSNMIDNYFI